MNPTLVRIEDVADFGNLSWAFWRAATGHRQRPDVQSFERNLDGELRQLAGEIHGGSVEVGRFHRFVVHDPKRRVIHAPEFRERVLHHALMRQLEPLFERALVDDTFACRRGKGSLAAAWRAQQHVRRFAWFVKTDVRKYFDSVDHELLLAGLRRRVKGSAVLALCERIVRSYATEPGKGLPIGALTSQHFANLYLAPFDRFLLASPQVHAIVRYMDDVVWWCADRDAARATLDETRRFLDLRLRLQLKPSAQIQPSERGVLLCGFRVQRSRLLLSRRRRRRYADARRRLEREWLAGRIDGTELQAGVTAALAITAHADARAWRSGQLARVPPVDA